MTRHPGTRFVGAMAVLALAAIPTSAQTMGQRILAGDNDVLQWNALALQAIRDSKLGPPVAARALAILHTCLYDGWAAYDAVAVGTMAGERARRPVAERSATAQRAAFNEAAYWAFIDLFPRHRGAARDQMTRVGLVPTRRIVAGDPQSIGRTLCSSVLARRHRDGANQLGDLNGGTPYADYSGYTPKNSVTRLVDIEHWRPEVSSTLVPPTCLVPHWGRVETFAFKVGPSTRPPAPAPYPGERFVEQAEELVALSAGLTDTDKAIVEYWMDGPQSETPPGHWNLFAQQVSRRDGHGIDEDVAVFFALNNALFDASVAAWEAKIHYDYVRPISAIRYLFAGKRIEAWGGPGRGTVEMTGDAWRPFQRANQITPPFPEYVSGHSTFSAAAAEILMRVTASDRMDLSHTVAPRSSLIEPRQGPARTIVLSWATFSEAALQAGYSRRLGGIHFAQADVEGQRLGRRVAQSVWDRVLRLLRRQPASTSP